MYAVALCSLQFHKKKCKVVPVHRVARRMHSLIWTLKPLTLWHCVTLLDSFPIC